MDFSDQQEYTICHALHVAAEKFDEDAKTMAAANLPTLVEQFQKQARETREILAMFEGDDAPALDPDIDGADKAWDDAVSR